MVIVSQCSRRRCRVADYDIEVGSRREGSGSSKLGDHARVQKAHFPVHIETA